MRRRERNSVNSQLDISRLLKQLARNRFQLSNTEFVLTSLNTADIAAHYTQCADEVFKTYGALLNCYDTLYKQHDAVSLAGVMIHIEFVVQTI